MAEDCKEIIWICFECLMPVVVMCLLSFVSVSIGSNKEIEQHL